ncbi:MAG: hypothetical protein WBX00_27900, partial [Isosphaeraceae bacterium]
MLIQSTKMRGRLAVAMTVGICGAFAALLLPLSGLAHAEGMAGQDAQPVSAPRVPGMMLGIMDRAGPFAAREIFYEERNGQAVTQGDIAVGEAAKLEENLLKELGKLSRF